MRQETGKTNLSGPANEVSIQLKLGGHSFSVDMLPEQMLRGADPVAVEVQTERTMLIPAELFDPQQAAAYLAANGMPCREDECAVWSATDAGAPVAVMAIAAAAAEALRTRLGDRLHYTTPLLGGPMEETGNVVRLYRTDALLYIKVWSSSLRLAEVIAAPDEADLLYFMERLDREFGLKNYEGRIGGDDPKRLRKLVAGYFKRTVCA